MARQLMTALARLGHVVEPIRDARAFLGTPALDSLRALEGKAARQAQALVAGWRAAETAPDLWFTYHSYYKAPDLLGPTVAAMLAIPYVVAEASDSKRRAEGEWAAHVALARTSIAAADLHLCFTDRDREGIAPLCRGDVRLLALPPFITTQGLSPQRRDHAGPTSLITVAMMRDGVKHESYLALARTLARLSDRPWRLSVIGDGPRRSDVERAFAAFGESRIIWRGALEHQDVAAELARHDIFVWPGLGEAYGLVYLEAQAAGLPVVAFDSAGVPWTVQRDETAFLAPEGDEAQLASALARLIDSPALRRSMGEAAALFISRQRSPDSACAVLSQGLDLAFEAHRHRRGRAS